MKSRLPLIGAVLCMMVGCCAVTTILPQWYLDDYKARERASTPILDELNLQIAEELPIFEGSTEMSRSMEGNTWTTSDAPRKGWIIYGRLLELLFSIPSGPTGSQAILDFYDAQLSSRGWSVVDQTGINRYRLDNSCLEVEVEISGGKTSSFRIRIYQDEYTHPLAPKLPEPLVVWSILQYSTYDVLNCSRSAN